jgi:hypothetical protein
MMQLHGPILGLEGDNSAIPYMRHQKALQQGTEELASGGGAHWRAVCM